MRKKRKRERNKMKKELIISRIIKKEQGRERKNEIRIVVNIKYINLKKIRNMIIKIKMLKGIKISIKRLKI